jgi:hypothetical protein
LVCVAVFALLAATHLKATSGSEAIIVKQAGRLQLPRKPQPQFIKGAWGDWMNASRLGGNSVQSGVSALVRA